jgi:hypothetical protein
MDLFDGHQRIMVVDFIQAFCLHAPDRSGHRDLPALCIDGRIQVAVVEGQEAAPRFVPVGGALVEAEGFLQNLDEGSLFAN